jgi:outer membrane protein OmpA-like peptidoglycan-associated protein
MEAQTARNQSSDDRMQLDEERSSRQRAEAQAQRAQAEAAAARVLPPLPPAQTQTVVQVLPAAREDPLKADLRVRMLQDLNSVLPALDTPRGLVVTLQDGDFRGAGLNPAVYGRLLRIAAIVSAHRGLYIQVDGHTDNVAGESRAEQFSYERAVAVREELARAGMPANSMSARGVGSGRPLVSNATASGRQQNRRVEITISGDPIGSLPYWDKTYPVAPQR